MKKQYPYSNDTEFLSKIDKLHVRDQWVKIILLEYNSEIPLKNIEGKVASGTLTKNGDSAVRRTCSLSCVVDAFKYKPEEIQSDYSISKKIFLELGITNDTDNYKDEEIIWFPQGVFFITSFAISTSATGNATINLQFKDKMAQLDGTVGGILPATTRFDTVTTIINGVAHTDKTLVYDIIMELVNHFGNEDISNIIIDDIPRKAKRIVRWMGLESLWIYPITNGKKIAYDVCLTSDLKTKTSASKPYFEIGEDNNKTKIIIGSKEYKTNQDIGYVYEDFVYDEELTFNAGSKVTDVLDKIKSWLGNYEYFYDEYGQFHFQEIKNYLNNPQSNNIWNKIKNIDDPNYLYEIMDDSGYLYETTKGKAVYTFDDNTNLISITNTPVYENIKNDFIVEGTMTVNNVKRTCRYHLVIDDKPTVSTNGYDNVLIYTDPSSGNVTATKPKIIAPTKKNQWILPESGEKGKIYGLLEEPQTFTYQKVLEDMGDFDLYYTKAITSENNLIEEENSLILEDSETNSNNINSIKDFLFALLERYMGYPDITPYKEKYMNVVFTLARQLKRYIKSNGDRKEITSPLTEQYFDSLYNKFDSDKNIIENQSGDQTILINKISWCGGLLKLLKELFSSFNDKDLGDEEYINEKYWPAINSELLSLWSERPPFINGLDSLKNWRKSRCLEHIDMLQVKQKQLSILIEQYTQIMNNYNTLFSSVERNGGNTASIIIKRDIVQNQINNFSEQQKVCNERLTLLHAALSALGASNLIAGQVYYPVDITVPVRLTSFWYYNTDKKKDNYGWNKVSWYQYYCKKSGKTEWYPEGLGPMIYIDYSKVPRNYFAPNVDEIPSMNRYSSWYENYYEEYAKKNDLPYFNRESDIYVPTNWRTELFLMGLRAEENGTDPGPYYQELKLNWPTVFDFKNNKLLPTSIACIDYFVGNTGVMLDSNAYSFSSLNSKETAKISFSDSSDSSVTAKFKAGDEAAIKNFLWNYENDHYYYFFDMIDSSSSTWGEYSVKNIGRRTNVNVSNSVNCVFAPEIPNYAFINVSNLTLDKRKEKLTELQDVAEDIIQVTDYLYKDFATGGFKQSAYDQIRYDLQQHTSYQNTISITAIPCFYLEPNVRVELNDHSTNTFGDYLVKSISIPLGAGNNMSVSMSKVMERI